MKTLDSANLATARAVDWERIWDEAGADAPNVTRHEWNRTLSPLRDWYGKSLKGKKAQAVLQICFHRAEKQFAKICRRRGLECWLPALRSLRDRIQPVNAYETYATLCLLKYCDLSADDAIPLPDEEAVSRIAVPNDPEFFAEVQRLACLGFLMAAVANEYRRVGKGVHLNPSKDDPLENVVPDSVRLAMARYEARRQEEELFRDSGIMLTKPMEEQNQGLLDIAFANKGVRYVNKETGESWPAVRIPLIRHAQAANQILAGYREAIEKTYSVSLETIFHFLPSVAILTQTSVPKISVVEGNNIQVSEKGSKFLRDISLKGYFRYPHERWLQSVAKVRSKWASSKEESQRRTRDFFEAFCVKPSDQESIDLGRFWPRPFCFRTPNNWVYVDVQSTGDFLRTLVEAGKDWFSSQTGDRFTLAMLSRVENECPSVTVVGSKYRAQKEGKGTVECDLLLATESKLFVVECKAYGKSPKFYRGDIDSVKLRTLTLREAMKQAEKQASAVRRALVTGLKDIPFREGVEAVVCMPSQEYIHPVDAFGYISGDIPRICTPEELVQRNT